MPSQEMPLIFLGPSLSEREARDILDAEYRPPVKRGDLDALLTYHPRIIGIVDGQFFQNLAVSPKEILRALEKGFTVFGASSMGALRAVELAPFGMIGVGKIYELYRSGEIDADDEVAMIYGEDDKRPLSEPMVNIRIALNAAFDAGIFSAVAKRNLIRLAKSLYFPDRTYPRLLELAERVLPKAELEMLHDFLLYSAPDAKREDAIQMLLAIRTRSEGGA